MASQELEMAGGVVSLDPLVTFSRSGPKPHLGLAGARPALFRKRRALHLVGFAHTTEAWSLDQIATDIARLQEEMPDSRFVLCVNSDYEGLLLSGKGLAVVVAPPVILLDERTFRPLPAPDPAAMFDAVYNARPDPFKRHELAVTVKSLMLIYWTTADAGHLQRLRGLLPDADYANHRSVSGEYQWLSPEQIAEQLSRCRVGLCLSAAEGAMRAAMEYLLCGLKVVSTESIGGRDRYLMPPYALIVEPEPEAVAKGVREMLTRNIPKSAVRDHIGRIIAFERHNFLAVVNRIGEKHFGIQRMFRSVDPFISIANKYVSVSAAAAALGVNAEADATAYD